jgi:hypothetical protein
MPSISTQEGIANLALLRIGASGSISDLDTDTGTLAEAARGVYFNDRDMLLRAHTWNFNTKRVQLTDSGEDPAFGWDEAYALPADYWRVISVHATDDEQDQPRYKVETQEVGGDDTLVILINSSTCFLRYAFKETDPAKWGAMFQDALAWRVAASLSLVLPVSNTSFQVLDTKAERALGNAKTVDGIEDWPDQLPDGTWVTDRDEDLDDFH